MRSTPWGHRRKALTRSMPQSLLVRILRQRSAKAAATCNGTGPVGAGLPHLGQGAGIGNPRVPRFLLLLAGVLCGAGITFTTLAMLASDSGVLGGMAPTSFLQPQAAFSDLFRGNVLGQSDWNPYITSGAAGGTPWNANGRGGSGPEDYRHVVDLEYDLPGQVRVHNGLQIVAQRTPTVGVLAGQQFAYPWRSGAVSTYGYFEFTGGYVQIDAKMPTAPGLWPGLFMLPGAGRAGKADNAEIDIFEGGYLGQGNPADNFSWTLHRGSAHLGGVTNVGTDLGAGFHLYGLDWVPGKSVTWYFDGRQVGQVTSAQMAIPNEPMELIMDVQVANGLAGSFHTLTSSATPPLDTMEVRSVKVFPLR